ncbi:MAG: hypothetical protein Q7J46_15375 [Pseudomonas sp.]|nr:hypothetical protein [Pseudomonas sp.]
MQSIRHRLLAIAAATLSLGANATEDGYSATYTNCMDASGGVTMNMLNCMGGETQQQDARLNHSYKAAMQALECSGLMKPDTHLGENARQIEVSDDQATSFLFY